MRDAPVTEREDPDRTGGWFNTRLVAVPVASLLLGAGTSYAQTVLPAALASFANSASGWTILCAALVIWARPRIPVGAVAGVVSFLCLVLGYTLASELRGFPYTPTFWLVASLIAGPVVGAAAAAARQPSAAAAAAGRLVLGGLLVADGVRGLTVLAATTSPVYWTVVAGLGVALVVSAVARLRGRRRT